MHNLTVGNSGTGKSNLNKRFAADAVAVGQNVIIYDPLKATDWPDQCPKFASPELFLRHVKKAQSAHVFVDEAKSLWDYDPKQADKLLYNRRHQGLLVYLIAQRTKMVPPNARNQCSKVFAFRQQKSDADILSDEYHEDLYNTKVLKPGEFIFTNGFNCATYLLDYSKGLPPLVEPLNQPTGDISNEKPAERH